MWKFNSSQFDLDFHMQLCNVYTRKISRYSNMRPPTLFHGLGLQVCVLNFLKKHESTYSVARALPPKRISFFPLEQKRDIILVDNPYHTIPDDYMICLPCNWLLRWLFVQHETSIITASVAMPTLNATIRSVLSPPVSVVPLTVSACQHVCAV